MIERIGIDYREAGFQAGERCEQGALDRYVWGDKWLTLCRCANCGCVTHWQPIDRTVDRMGVNFRNFDPSVIESTRIRRFDGAKTWKFLN